MDDEDYIWLNQWQWMRSSHGYAISYIYGAGKCRRIFMHRLILGAKPGQFVDHRNQNRLDNQRCNIRFATKSQNAMNMRKPKGTSSRFKGVYWCRQQKKWKVQCGTSKQRGYVGSFADEHLAALMYDFWALERYGDFACTNFKVIKWGP